MKNIINNNMKTSIITITLQFITKENMAEFVFLKDKLLRIYKFSCKMSLDKK